jgi:hypothetical protein
MAYRPANDARVDAGSRTFRIGGSSATANDLAQHICSAASGTRSSTLSSETTQISSRLNLSAKAHRGRVPKNLSKRKG